MWPFKSCKTRSPEDELRRLHRLKHRLDQLDDGPWTYETRVALMRAIHRTIAECHRRRAAQT